MCVRIIQETPSKELTMAALVAYIYSTSTLGLRQEDGEVILGYQRPGYREAIYGCCYVVE